MPERPYQDTCNTNVIAAYDQHWHQQIVAMATGTGKTWVFSALYERIKSRLPGQMLVLAHTEELVDQNIAAMQEINPSLRVDKEMAEHKADPSLADVICASVKTLGRLGTTRLAKYDMARWDKVIVDEAHHTPANSYMNVLNAFHVLEDGTNKLLLGVTATPERSDGKALGAIYKKLSYVYSLRQAIDDGYLVKVRGYVATTETSLASVGIHDGDLNRVELEAAIDSPQRNRLVVEAWLTRCEERKTVVYSAGILHAQHLAQEFIARGVEAQALWGEDPDRKVKLQWHRDTAGGVLVNADLLIEGYNDPSISCVVISAPTASSARFTQMCGRATRLFPGKVDCIILVALDISSGHSLCTLPTLMGMPANLDMCGESLTDTCKLLEAMQAENPNIDFTKLKTVQGLQQFITEFNLFEIRFPAEVEANSDFIWSKAIDGGYVMRIPLQKADATGNKPGLVRIHQNLLDKWDVDGYIGDRTFHGERASIEEAFAVADQQIRERAPASVVLVNRKASWMTKPATDGQMKLLARLYGKGKVWPESFTQGQASVWINKRIGGKK
jgi:superfamily II DNA or RNA helicase